MYKLTYRMGTSSGSRLHSDALEVEPQDVPR